MSSVQLRFDGMAELRAALRKMPEEIAGEAGHIVEGTANAANGEIRRAYPSHTGRLIGGVVTTHFEHGKVAAGAVVKSSAPHAHIFEFGTKGKARKNRRGWNRGVMPAAPAGDAMIPIVVRARRRMYSQLADLLRRRGFTLEGSL